MSPNQGLSDTIAGGFKRSEANTATHRQGVLLRVSLVTAQASVVASFGLIRGALVQVAMGRLARATDGVKSFQTHLNRANQPNCKD